MWPFSRQKIDSDLSKYRLGRCIGVGGNSHCYEIKGHPKLVLITLSSTGFGIGGTKGILERANKLMQIHKKIPQGVNAAKILQIGFKDNRPALIMERALGNPVHTRKPENHMQWSNRLNVLANVPQKQYNKLMMNMKTIHKLGLKIDPSKPDNIFYHPRRGFTLIDLDFGSDNSSLIAPIIYTYNLFTKFRTHLTERDKKNILKIIQKLKAAGDSGSSYTESQINSCLNEIR